jgi:hypothetical protein
MKPRLLLIILLLLPLASHANEAAETPRPPFNNRGTPEEFLRDLYAHFNFPDRDNAPDILNKDASILAAPTLLALIEKNKKLSSRESSLYDSNPLCDCQDWDKFVVKAISVSQENNDQAISDMTYSISHNFTDIKQTFKLSRINGEWKINDIRYDHSLIYQRNYFTLRKAIEFSIKNPD